MALFLFCISLLAFSASQPCEPALVLNKTAFQTSPYFASWNIDASRDRLFFDTNFSDRRLVYLASNIGGANIRFGGTGNDYLSYSVPGAAPFSCEPGKLECLNTTWLDNLHDLSLSSNNGLVFGLNIHPENASSPPKGPWDPTNARALLSYLKAQNRSLFGVELGNEQNTIMSAQQQAQAFGVLSSMLDDVYGKGEGRPALVGPDPHSFKDAGSSVSQLLAYIKTFLSAMQSQGTQLRAMTHHEYIEVDYKNIVDPSFLDITGTIASGIVAAVRSVNPTVEIWAGALMPPPAFSHASHFLSCSRSLSLSHTHTRTRTRTACRRNWTSQWGHNAQSKLRKQSHLWEVCLFAMVR
jgi:hypothetical protein